MEVLLAIQKLHMKGSDVAMASLTIAEWSTGKSLQLGGPRAGFSLLHLPALWPWPSFLTLCPLVTLFVKGNSFKAYMRLNCVLSMVRRMVLFRC